ncbi:phosphatidylinositol N-acetylglucosaminyltransferase subunit A-like isoform X6 [Malus domestica]|uniref:phosphatidylinositol N-acetylglucosaminyltransferase subunit A-like isoform X6 n=1 Tax=Malus domestica TaxID=3750 RepID=UPI003974C085
MPFIPQYGPKHVRLEELREKYSLQDRVEMLGAVQHSKLRSVLVSGHIFLNSSLTEAFCIAILEAASCGLLTVSTRVGGVPEVLPDDMIVFAKPDPSDMVQAIEKAISILPRIDPQDMHSRELYNWHDVAKRTEIVYDRALKCSNQNLLQRLSRQQRILKRCPILFYPMIKMKGPRWRMQTNARDDCIQD